MSDNEFLLPPPWRNRTSSKQRNIAIAVTFALYALTGAGLTGLAVWLLDAIGAPGWFAALFWLVPTVITTVWALYTKTPAFVAEIESQSWTEYVVRLVMVGSETPRPRPARLVTGVLFGAPVAYGAVVLAVLTLIGFG